MSMSYEIDDLRTPETIKSQILDQIVYGYVPVFEEEIEYETGTDDYTLDCDGADTKDLKDILRVRGLVDGTEYLFSEGSDYRLKDTTGNDKYDSISFDPGGEIPDDESYFSVDYRYFGTPSDLTDTSEGSVLSTITEAVAMQVYKTELQMNNVARDSFIATASGDELDMLGELVDVDRNDAEFSTGYVTLKRSASLSGSGDITIPKGSQVSTIGSSTSSVVTFETTATAQILNTETTAQISDASHPEYEEYWVPVKSMYPGKDMNVSSETIVKNVTAPNQVTIINNPTSFDKENEQVEGTGTTYSFELNHAPDSSGLADKDGDGKYIEMRNELARGWMDQPNSLGTITITITDGEGSGVSWTGTATITGWDGSQEISENIEFSGSTSEISSNSFEYIYHVSFLSSTGTGLVDGSEYAKIEDSGSNVLLNEHSCGRQVDSGFLKLRSDGTTELKVYLYDGSSWVEQTGSGTDYTHTTASFNGKTWSIIEWSSWGTGDKLSDGSQNVKYEYVPHEDWYDLDGDTLELEGSPRTGSYLELDYTWENTFSSGADRESDDVYRERIKTGVTAAAKGTLSAVRAAVLAVEGIAGAEVYDHSTDASIDVGEIEVYAWSQNGTLSEAKRELVSDAVDVTRAAGIAYLVSGPTAIYIAINATVRVHNGEGYVLSDVEDDCNTAITDWLDSFELGENLVVSQLITTLESIEAVSYVDMDSIEIWGYDSPDDADGSESTIDPYGSGWSWDIESSSFDYINILSDVIVKPDTDDTGNSIDISAAFE